MKLIKNETKHTFDIFSNLFNVFMSMLNLFICMSILQSVNRLSHAVDHVTPSLIQFITIKLNKNYKHCDL